MAKEEFSIKTMFQTRLSPEETDEIQEAIIELVPDIDPERLNNHVLFMRIFRLALGNAKKIFVQRPEDTAAIQNLTNEIGRLKTLVDLKDDELLKVNKLYSEKNQLAIALETELNGKIDEVENIKTEVPDPKAIVLMFPEKAKTLLSLACSRIAQRTKQEVTPDLLLWDLFWDYVRGIADHKYPFVIKSSDLKETKHE